MNALLVLLAFGLVLLNGFFVATEFAVVKVRPTRIDALAAEGSAAARHGQRIIRSLDDYLSATQLGITLASLGLGWIGEPAFASLIEGALGGGGWLTQAAAHSLALTAAFVLITFLHIVVGELAPKSLAIQRPEQTTLAVAVPIRLFHGLFYPLIWGLNGAARVILRLVGLKPASPHDLAHTGEELRLILALSAEHGGIGRAQAELMQKALAFGRRTARQMMVPRQEVALLSTTSTLEENLARAREAEYTRFPLCEGTLDHVLGVVDIKDVLHAEGVKDLRPFAQPPLFVPETATAEALLRQFRESGERMAIVVDEYGGASGVLTLDDLVAQVVGDVSEQPMVRPRRGPEILIDGTTPIEEVAERLGAQVDTAEITTIAGWFQRELKRLPVRGDVLPLGEFELRVEEADGPRLRTVRVLKGPVKAKEAGK